MKLVRRLDFATRMKIRTRMLFLTAVVFFGFIITLGLAFHTVSQVRIGSSAYQRIKADKDLIEQITMLKSDLNQVRGELLNLVAGAGSDGQERINEEIRRLAEEINGTFATILKLTDSEEEKVAVQDAQATWQEFADTTENELVPAVRQGSLDKARELATSVQKMRYERFIEQIGSMVDAQRLEIEEKEAAAARLIRLKLVIAGATAATLFLIVLATMFFVSRSITKPLLDGVAFAQSVAGGNLSETISVKSQDEIGELSEALNRMVEGLGSMVLKVSASAQDLSKVSADIFTASRTVIETADQQAAGVKETSAAVQEINDSVAEVAQGVDGLSLSSSETSSSILEMTASVEEVAHNMESLGESVEDVSSSITEIAAAIKQISESVSSLMSASATTASSVSQMDSSIKEVEKNSRQTAAISSEVLTDAESGQKSVEATITGMNEIRNSSRIAAEVIGALSGKAENIGAIIKVIDEVTEQTNLLALNAAIIAAQAGEQGKGFAVVADEIKELAERTKSSTGEISQLIKGVQEETRRAVEAIGSAELSIEEGALLSRRSGDALAKIVSGVQRATEQVNTIARAAMEQATGSRMINESMEQVSAMVQQIGNATREQAKVSDLIMTAVERMKGLAGQVRSSTREQAKTSGAIANSAEQINGMVSHIKAACDTQTESSAKIVRAVGAIEQSTGKNLDATTILETAVSSLSGQTDILQREMAAFRVGKNAATTDKVATKADAETAKVTP